MSVSISGAYKYYVQYVSNLYLIYTWFVYSQQGYCSCVQPLEWRAVTCAIISISPLDGAQVLIGKCV